MVDTSRGNYFLDALILHLSLCIADDTVEEVLWNVPLLGIDRFHCELTSADHG